MTLEQQWLEYDFNPFILFSSTGKIISLNGEAQFLLGTVSAKTIFELATTYANVNFGFKTTFVELEYGRYKFFGLTVGYEDENQIGIKLYQAPSLKLNATKPEGELTNIFTIIDLCIASHSINTNITYTKFYDPTIPEVRLNANKLIQLLNKIYDAMKKSETIDTKVFYRVGEHIKFEGEKYSLFSITITSNNIDADQRATIELLAKKNNFYIETSPTFTINIPMITT